MNPEQELAQLQQRLEEIKQATAAKKQRLKEVERHRRQAINREMRRARYRITAQERKRRTRRLILMGTYMERVISGDAAAKAHLIKDLDESLERDRDRELFDLPPREGRE